MSASSNVTAGNVAAATDYNNLRTDVLNTSTGHRHDGTDSRTLATATPAAVGYAAATGSGPNGSLSDHVHALSMTSYQDTLTGDVTMTSSNTHYTAVSRSLVAGTWLVIGRATFEYGLCTVKLWDGSSGAYATAETNAGAGSNSGSATAHALITLGSTTTVYLSGACTTSGKKIFATVSDNGVTNTATQLVCIRIA